MNANNNNHTNGIKTAEQLFSEAPASWNTRYLDPNGFECQITLRAETGSELLEKAASAIAYLLKNGCIPFVSRSYMGRKDSGAGEAQVTRTGDEKTNGNNNNPAWCPIHQCEMKRWDKDGRTWYSHKVNGEWCTGK